MRIILIIIFFSIQANLFAQIDNGIIIEKDGSKYYEHTVEKGQTAFAISKIYKISLNELYNNNPSAEQGLSKGQILYIPFKEIKQITNSPDTLNLDTLNNEIKYIIKKGDTYYSLSKRYSISVDNLSSYNNNINLQLGETILIPKNKVDTNDISKPLVKLPFNPYTGPCDSIIIHKVAKKETLYSIAKIYNVEIQSILDINEDLDTGLKRGSQIRIKIKIPDCDESLLDTLLFDTLNNISNSDSLGIKDIYTIVLMLPFDLDLNDSLIKHCPPLTKCKTLNNTKQSINFYNGVILALDSLKKAGLNLNLIVLDTKNDTVTVNKLLKNIDVENTDLIIGPIFSKSIKLVVNFAKKNKINVVCPMSIPNKVLFNNKYLTKLISSIQTQVQELANYIYTTYNKENVLLICHNNDANDVKYSEVCKRTYNSKITETEDSLNIYKLSISASIASLQSSLKKEESNILILTSRNDEFISNFMSKLIAMVNTYKYKDYEIIVVGLENCLNINTVDEKYKNRFSLHIVKSGHIDYNSDDVKGFIQSYRNIYKTDPLKFTFIGFDAAFSSVSSLFLYGTNFKNSYNKLHYKGFYIDVHNKQVDSKSGYENSNVRILKYSDYKLIRVN